MDREMEWCMMSEKIKAKDLVGFESLLGSLEDVVSRLESGDLDLETAVECYERGIRLSRKCDVKLNEFEEKIKSIQGEKE